MTVLGLLVATFITQGQPFLPTLSTLFTVNREQAQQHFINQCLPNSIAEIRYSYKLSALNSKYQKLRSVLPNKISCQGSDSLVERLEKKVNYSNVKLLASDSRSLRFTPGEEWDIPIPHTDRGLEQRLLAQYYRGENLPVLRYGNTGNAVRVLQTLLTYNRYGVGVNGRFDVLTETAVKAFQANRRLGADGIVGPRTWKELTRYAALHTKKQPMEIPMLSNEPLYPWQKRLVVNFADAVSI